MRVLPVLHSLGLPLLELSEVNFRGASPIYATTFCIRSHVSKRVSSARMAAMVASPIPGIERSRSPFVLSSGSGPRSDTVVGMGTADGATG